MMPRPFRAATLATLTALAVAVTCAPAGAETIGSIAAFGHDCTAPSNLTRLDYTLDHVAKRLKSGGALKIVAIGSSSTAGAGATSPAASYPSRLQVELRQLFPKSEIVVVNRGVNGEEARDMLARLDASVISEKPDLVLWQMGTNAVLRDQPTTPSMIRDGVRRMRASGADVILIDPQFAPKVLAKTEIDETVDLMSTAAKQDNVSLFHRFAVMRYWRQTVGIPYGTFLSPDELHMNDWGYGCVAKLLAHAISEAATRPEVTTMATAPQR